MTDPLAAAREALAAFDHPTTRTLSRAYGEALIGGSRTSQTGLIWQCRRNGVDLMFPMPDWRELPEVPERSHDVNERYFAHAGRVLEMHYPHLTAEIEAMRVVENGPPDVTIDHLRAALARVDELTVEVERLRLAGITCTRGTECHITRGRDV